MAHEKYGFSVFINCPFDEKYRHIFEAIVFCVQDCGYIARCSLEVSDGSVVRIDKIFTIISDCRLGIHDISRVELDPDTDLPRFNMPLELGIFLGAKRFGDPEQQEKNCLILDLDRYRFQKFISDISGQDISAHGGKAKRAVLVVRDWLRDATPKSVKIPGAERIWKRYELFRTELPAMCEKLALHTDELSFNDYAIQVEEWLKLNSAVPLR